jgi:hypothetical protein
MSRIARTVKRLCTIWAPGVLFQAGRDFCLRHHVSAARGATETSPRWVPEAKRIRGWSMTQLPISPPNIEMYNKWSFISTPTINLHYMSFSLR